MSPVVGFLFFGSGSVLRDVLPGPINSRVRRELITSKLFRERHGAAAGAWA